MREGSGNMVNSAAHQQRIDSLQELLKPLGNGDFLFVGDTRQIVYTYNKTPLAGLKPGQHFRGRIDKTVPRMESTLTGYVWHRDHSNHEYAISYHGVPLGTARLELLPAVEKAIDAIGGELYLDLSFDHWYQRGWPEITMGWTGKWHMEKIIKLLQQYRVWPVDTVRAVSSDVRASQNRVQATKEKLAVGRLAPGCQFEDAKISTFSPESDRETSFLRRHKHWDGNCEVRALPVPQGSQAKPRIGVYHENQEVYVSRARRNEYELLREYVGGQVHVSIRFDKHGVSGYDHYVDNVYTIVFTPLQRPKHIQKEQHDSVPHHTLCEGQPINSDSLVNYLQNQGLEIFDKRNQGGSLWVIGDESLQPMMDELRTKGVVFRYKPEGGRATKRKSAWWMK